MQNCIDNYTTSMQRDNYDLRTFNKGLKVKIPIEAHYWAKLRQTLGRNRVTNDLLNLPKCGLTSSHQKDAYVTHKLFSSQLLGRQLSSFSVFLYSTIPGS